MNIFGLLDDTENFDEESELRTTFGNYKVLLYSLYLSCYIFLKYQSASK